MTPEGEVKDDVKNLLEQYEPHGLWWYMPVSCGYGKHGIPDFIICFVGQFIAVETKRRSRKQVRPLQAFQMSLLRAAGAIAMVVNNAEDLELLQVQLNLLLTKKQYAPAP